MGWDELSERCVFLQLHKYKKASFVKIKKQINIVQIKFKLTCHSCEGRNPIELYYEMKQYFVYILASKKNGTLYIGVTNNLLKRVYQHKNKLVEGFTKKY
jgi:hypothetical protein